MIRTRSLWLLLALAAAVSRGSAQVTPVPLGAVRTMPDSEARRAVGPYVGGPSDQLLQPVFVGPFGPSATTAVTVFRSRDRCSLLALTDEGAGWRRVPADSLQRSQDRCWQILAVLADNLDADADREIIVLGSYLLGVDSAELEVPFLAAAAFDWNGRTFARLLVVERSVQGLASAREIRAALRDPSFVGAEPVRALPDSQARRLFAPSLAGGERVQRPAVVGPIGPSRATAMALVRRGDRPSGFRALALANVSGNWRSVPVPLLEAQSDAVPTAVMFLNLDSDADLEVVVLATYSSGVGPMGAAEFPRNSVLDWTGQAFVRVPALEQRIAEANGFDDALRALTAPPRRQRP